jgi:DNA-binding response OmpR family regulator
MAQPLKLVQGSASAPGARVRPGPMRVAIADDDSGFVTVLSKRVSEMGWEQRALSAPPRAEDLTAMRVHALVVDLTLLGDYAWTYLEELSAELPALGVIVCTGQSTVAQRVRGLRAGADDWITKPCHPQEVVARIEAAVRRHKRSDPEPPEPIQAGELDIRPDQYQAFVAGQSIELTRREFELLHLLASSEGRVLAREDIYRHVWGYTMIRGDRSVDVFVRKLRQKIERVSPCWTYLHTHFAVGYRFEAVATEEDDAELEGRPPGRGLPPAG